MSLEKSWDFQETGPRTLHYTTHIDHNCAVYVVKIVLYMLSHSSVYVVTFCIIKQHAIWYVNLF